MNKLRLITFDLDHTLWDPDAALREGERASHAWLADRVPAFAEQFSADAFLQLRVRLREQRPELVHRVSEIRRVANREALLQVGLSADDAAALAEQAFDVFWRARQRVAVYAEAEALLAELASRYVLGALSNGNACLQTIGLADYFSFHFAGENFPAAKPAPDMFLAALQRVGVAAHEALHIGDHPVDDMQGAQLVGMQTLWFNAAGADWPEGLRQPDYCVTSLPAILACLSASG